MAAVRMLIDWIAWLPYFGAQPSMNNTLGWALFMRHLYGCRRAAGLLVISSR